MVDPHDHPASVARQVLDTVKDRLPLLGVNEILDSHRVPGMLRRPLFSGVLEVSDVRGVEHAGWEGDRGMPIAPSLRRVHPIAASNRRSKRLPIWRCIWIQHPIEPAREALAGASQAVSLSFHADLQHLAEHGGAVVRRDQPGSGFIAAPSKASVN